MYLRRLGAAHALTALGLDKIASSAINKAEPALFTHTVHGLKIDISRPAGSERRRKLPDGSELVRRMSADYGDMPGYMGIDNDNLDAFVGPDPASRKAYVFNLLNYDGTGKKKLEEQKLFLGFPNRAAFQKAMETTFVTPKYRGPVYAMDIDKLKKRLEETPPGQPLRR